MRLNTLSFVDWEAIFSFLRFCIPLSLGDSQPLLLHRGLFVWWEFPLLNESKEPKAIQTLRKQERKKGIQRFLGVVGIMIAPFFALWIYTQSSFYPCNLYDAVAQGDVEKVEKLLKNGANPNVECIPNYDDGTLLLLDKTFELIFVKFYKLYGKRGAETPLDRAIKNMEEVKKEQDDIKKDDVNWTTPELEPSPKTAFKSDEIIMLLLEYGAETKHIYKIFRYASKVENMEFMFYNATSFNQPLDKWDTNSVKDMEEDIFYDSPLENNPPKWYKK